MYNKPEYNQNADTDRRMKLWQLFWTGIVACLMGMMTGPASGATRSVIMGNFFFNPTNITVAQGDTIVWTRWRR